MAKPTDRKMGCRGFRRQAALSRREILTVGSDLPARVWDSATGQLLRTLDAPEIDSVNATAFSSDASLLAVAGPSNQTPDVDVVQFWNVRTGRPVRTIKIRRKYLYLRDAAFLDHGRTLALASDISKAQGLWVLC